MSDLPNHSSQDNLNAKLFSAILQGDMEMVSSDGYTLTDKGREKVELLLTHDPEAIKTIFVLTAHHLKMYLSKHQQKILQDTLDLGLRQINAKHELITQLYEAIEAKDKQLEQLSQPAEA